jgi:murein L,D-transpeptidase YcbB/YkuD
MLAGAACAALIPLAMPAAAATSPSLPVEAQLPSSPDQAVTAFYASRRNAPLWLRGGAATPAARDLIATLQRAPLDGLSSGPALAAEAQALIARAQSGDAAALAGAERLLSTAWILYVQALETPPAGVTYGDNWAAPRRSSPALILARAGQASSLADHIREVTQVNPLYAQLREAAWNTRQANGGSLDPRVVASLDRARVFPVQDRYIMVDAAGARLYMIDGNRIVDSMKVIVGKDSAQTPMMASTIHYATLNPYWNVPGDFIRSTMVERIKQQGIGYLKAHNYEILSADTGETLDPASVDWDAVGAGTTQVRMRQLPGPANSMGRMKFAFPNNYDIYLHDTPVKELFAQADRDLSHGCVRLEDAPRLGRWLLGRAPIADSNTPEQQVLLPKPVPIYVTYMTAQAQGGQLSFVEDIYGRDSARLSQVAALR